MTKQIEALDKQIRDHLSQMPKDTLLTDLAKDEQLNDLMEARDNLVETKEKLAKEGIR